MPFSAAAGGTLLVARPALPAICRKRELPRASRDVLDRFGPLERGWRALEREPSLHDAVHADMRLTVISHRYTRARVFVR